MKISADNSFGILKNGNWTGIRGQLQRGVSIIMLNLFLQFTIEINILLYINHKGS